MPGSPLSAVAGRSSGPSETEPQAGVVANSAWSILAQGVTALIGGAIGIYAVRTFAPSSWGQYSTALALVGLVSVVSGAGLGPLALRELTSDPERQGEILGVTFQALAWTSVLAAVVLLAIAPALGYPREVLVMVLVLAPLLALNPGLAILGSAFNARSRLVYAAQFQIAQALIYGALSLVVITTLRSVTGIAVSTVIAASGAAILGWVLLRRRLALRVRLDQPRGKAFTFLRAAIPFGAIGLVGLVYDRADVLMLSVLSSASSVAHYTVPDGFLRLAWMVPSVVSAAFFPLLSRRIAAGSADAQYLFFLVARVFLFVSLPMSLALAVASPTLLPLVFGQEYTASVPVLQIMAWTLAFGFSNSILWYGVLAVHQERRALFVVLGGLVANVAVNAVAIPLYGPSGAAAALVVSEALVVVGEGVLIHRHLFRLPLRELLARPVGAGVVLVPAAALLGTRSPVGAAVAGAAAYVAVLLVSGYVTVAEWQPVLSLLAAPFSRFARAR